MITFTPLKAGSLLFSVQQGSGAMQIEKPNQNVHFREYIRCSNCFRRGDITLTEWDVLMQLMEERREMIERAFVICDDLIARNRELELHNKVLIAMLLETQKQRTLEVS
jgi:hypothetical protein